MRLLATAVANIEPFTEARRGDGTALPDYLDGHRILADPDVLTILAGEIASQLPGEADHVVGEVAAGAALAVAVSQAAFLQGRRVQARMLRREPKRYGVTGVLNTPAAAGSCFAVVDDVAGTGASLERSVLRLRELGHYVSGAWVAVDRHNGAAQRLSALDVPFFSLLSIDELRPKVSD